MTSGRAGAHARSRPPGRQLDDEPPPVLGTWPRVYAVVAAYVIAVIALLWFFTRAFAP